MIKLTIPGRPVPCVRMTQRSKFADPKAQRYLAYKKTVGWMGKSKFKSPITEDVTVSVVLNFWLCGGQTPDIDNLIKAILDGLNKIAWVDDKQVVEVTARRYQADDKQSERAEVEINEVN